MTKAAPSWKELLSLISSQLFSGLCLLSNQHEVIFAHGILTNLSKEEIDQFFIPFCGRDLSESHSVFKLKSAQQTEFRVYHKTHISVYATTRGNHSGLTVSKLPHGIFLTVFHKPTPPHKAITLVESFTDKLRF